MLASWKKVADTLDDRPKKLSAEEVGYQPAPEGSAMRCGACHHFYRRATDSFSVCELFRSEETDKDGVDPSYRCHFYSTDGMVYPFTEEGGTDE